MSTCPRSMRPPLSSSSLSTQTGQRRIPSTTVFRPLAQSSELPPLDFCTLPEGDEEGDIGSERMKSLQFLQFVNRIFSKFWRKVHLPLTDRSAHTCAACNQWGISAVIGLFSCAVNPQTESNLTCSFAAPNFESLTRYAPRLPQRSSLGAACCCSRYQRRARHRNPPGT